MHGDGRQNVPGNRIGKIAVAAFLVDVNKATALNGAAVGSSAQGANAGDRNLAAGASEVLCFRVSLALSTGNAFQGATSAATFTFDAEQTANNP